MMRFNLAAPLLIMTLSPVAAQPVSTATIPQAALIQPVALANQIKSGTAPVILQVGFSVLYAQAHIPGAIYAGPSNNNEGIQNLRKQVKTLARDKPLVIYCGCCPWSMCPNIGAAWKELIAEGFRRVEVLYLADNFGADWVDKGYPVKRGT